MLNSNRIITLKNNRELKFQDSNNFTYNSIFRDENNKKCLSLRCNICNHEWNTAIYNYVRGCGCPKCAKQKQSIDFRISKNNLISQRKSKYSDSNNFKYGKIFMKGKYSHIQLICKICNHEWHTRTSIHLEGYNCPNCLRLSKLISINELKTKRDNKYSDSNNFTYNKIFIGKDNKTWINLTHKSCEYTWNQATHSHLRGCSCPNCGQSKGEKRIENYLKENNIEYEIQKTFPNCKIKRKLSFDFYISSKNFLIEYDGLQHFKPIKQFGGQKGYLRNIKSDIIKNEYSKSNKINLLRIPYWDYDDIEFILNQKLTE